MTTGRVITFFTPSDDYTKEPFSMSNASLQMLLGFITLRHALDNTRKIFLIR